MSKKTPSATRDLQALTFHPLTPDRWTDFETLFGANGACGGCWCQYWRRAPAQFNAGKTNGGNKRVMKKLVVEEHEPGVLAYADGRAIGWCAVAPRECYPSLARSRVLKAVDDAPVWSVSCLFVERSFRGKGVSVELLRAAVGFVAARGGKVVEGYPVEPKSSSMPAAFAWTGLASAFLRAGFQEHRRGSPTRPIMRFVVDDEAR